MVTSIVVTDAGAIIAAGASPHVPLVTTAELFEGSDSPFAERRFPSGLMVTRSESLVWGMKPTADRHEGTDPSKTIDIAELLNHSPRKLTLVHSSIAGENDTNSRTRGPLAGLIGTR